MVEVLNNKISIGSFFLYSACTGYRILTKQSFSEALALIASPIRWRSGGTYSGKSS